MPWVDLTVQIIWTVSKVSMKAACDQQLVRDKTVMCMQCNCISPPEGRQYWDVNSKPISLKSDASGLFILFSNTT